MLGDKDLPIISSNSSLKHIGDESFYGEKRAQFHSLEQDRSGDTLPDLVHITNSTCGACCFCADVCGVPECKKCVQKSEIIEEERRVFVRDSISNKYLERRLLNSNNLSKCLHYTSCQVRRHNHLGSAWLRCGNKIYDASDFISTHPGGERSILNKAGGTVDCTEDMGFHSKQAINMWKKEYIGVMIPCPGHMKIGLASENEQNHCIIS